MNSDILQRLKDIEQEGRNLQNQIIQRINQASSRKAFGNLAAEFMIGKVFPTGIKRAGKQFAKGALSRQKQLVEKETTKLTNHWLNKTINELNQVSKLTSIVTAKGNSTILIKKFNSAKSAVKAETKIKRGLAALQQLQTYDLFYNYELENILKEKKMKKTKTIKYKHFLNEGKKLLRKYPSELESFLGAIERLEQGGLDAYRQCMSSCRNCIENSIKIKAETNDWKAGLNILLSSETRKKTIRGTYNYLSAYGTHGKENPTEEDAKSGLEQTISSLRIILSQNK